MSEKAERRPLSKKEIEILTENGCQGSWDTIRVADGFNPRIITGSRLAGNISIGKDVLIRDSIIMNYDIGDSVKIDNVRSLVSVTSSCGNGVRVSPINENGGREIPIFEGLSAQVAYLMALYRHDAELIQKLEAMVSNILTQKTIEQGIVAENAAIIDCEFVENVYVGPGSQLLGVSHLYNGTIASDLADPTYVGTDVIAKDFIFAEGAKVTDATRLKRCYVGQGAKLENGFSAVDSVFFANSHFEQGEACSVFAGPFSVSHHKSTLLIAGMYSFYNAGSGTNNSNHMYKLGPVHQGILERGCKSGSESYLMWPSRIGAFTTVIGKHAKRLDLSSLPFSVLLERQGRSELYIGLNLTNVGLVRDGQKWPERDNRRMAHPVDQVNTKVFTPYKAQKMLAGIELLLELDRKNVDADCVLYHGVALRTPARGIELYQLALDQYFGDILLTRLMESTNGDVLDADVSRWVDLAGLIAPVDAVSGLLDDVKSGQVGDMAAIRERFKEIAANYAEYEWAWVAKQLEQRLGKPVANWQGDDFKSILKISLEASEKLTTMQIDDAMKEFDLSSRIGYGIDGDNDTQSADFTAVCGSADANATIQDLKEMLEQKKVQIQQIVQQM